MQRGIEGSGLAASGGAGDQEHTLGLEQQLLKGSLDIFRERELLQIEQGRVAVQQADDDLLTELRGQRRDAQLDAALFKTQPAAAVLRFPMLTDIQLGNDLKPRDQGRL